ncbi:polyketide synthase for naphthopyrone YWA1 [Xylaria sp. FL0933]|nr:polyketide synthase for naphthopyrone YWA1 [Xylaria sp. FL0933]
MSNLGHVYLFGDQTNDFVPGLRQLLRTKDRPLLSSFLEKTHLALRQEVAQQSRQTQEFLPRFSNVGDLFSVYSTDHEAAPVLASTLTTIYQLGSFIRHYGDGCRQYPSGPDHVVLGMCTGQLAASAIASASNISELAYLAVQTVVIAFRTGIQVTNARNLVDNGVDKNQNWSYIVPKLPVEMAISRIEQFSKLTNLTVGSRPFVGTVAPSSVTIFGQPSVLKDFFSSPMMKDTKPIPAPVFAPYHEPHLYSQSDVDDILEGVPEAVGNTTVKLPVISSVTGEPIRAATFGALLRVSLEEFLRYPLHLEKIIRSIGSSCEASTCDQWLISLVGTTSRILASALGEIERISVDVEHITSTPSTGTPRSQISSSGRPEQSRIAIIGYSGRFPEAANAEGLWKILQEGRDVHREIPADRFDVNAHYDPTGKIKNTSTIRYGCFINEPGVFDARFFNISPREADQSDPAQRLALMTAYEALEMAGVVPDKTPSTQRDRVGVFYGMTSDDWREVNSGQDVGTYYIPGTNRAFTPGRINYFFKFTGPSVNVDTACSSSAAAIHLACNSLWRNDCDTAIAGGTNVMTNPDNFAGLDKGHFLCKSGNCKTFDDGADGYCRADAVGTVILKRLEDALADKDPIQAVICGAYTNHSAEAESITRPNAGAQAAIFRRILNDSGHDASDVSYIEMHGTGTQAGDAVEMKSVLEVFAGKRSGRSATQNPLYLGSVKANVGHAESGSGVTSLIKVMMMMKNSEIPPHIGIKTKINKGFPTDLRERGIRIAMEATPWRQAADSRRMAFLNNFSAAGGNSALLIEDAPAPFEPQASEDPRTSHVVAISARTAQSLRRNAERLAEYLGNNPHTSLASVAYTTTARRIHHNYRLSVTGRTITDVKAALEQGAGLEARPIPRKQPGVAFAFTGQGSVYAGMGQNLFANFRVFRKEIQRLAAISESFGFDSFLPVINDSSASEAVTPQASQLALTCFEIALARLMESFGITPSVVVGHSLGEYAALHISGTLSARDVVFLVGTRARIMQERCSAGTHAMLAVKAPVSALAKVMQSHRLEVACINGPSQTVLAGLGADIDSAQEALKQSDVKSSKLITAFAFHSSQVEPVLDEFTKLGQGVVFRKPTVPVLSPLLAAVVTEEGQINTQYLARHCREVVDLVGAVQSALSEKIMSEDTLCVEIGPVPFVTGMLKSCIGSSLRTVAPVRKGDDLWRTLGDALSSLYQHGQEIQWGEYHRDFNDFHEVISLPAYAWDLKNHWIQYVNNWCLTKGNAPALVAEAPETPAVTPRFLSATCQKVLDSSHAADKSFVLVESDIAHPDLRAVFEAHKVNGAALCPSSAYADIAITLGKFLSKSNSIKSNTGIEIADMATTKPLLMRTPGKSELFRASAEADWANQTATVAYYSVNSRGETTQQHATCTIRFGNPDAWLNEWKRSAYLVKSRMQNLRDAAEDGICHRIGRGMVYKLFENCVEYGERFQGIEGVYLDSKGHEATARVTLKDKSTCFEGNPYYIDSLGHLSGFIMNATESFDYKQQVFLNHGWESIRCAVKLSPDETYHTYVKMQSTDGMKYIGDVYIFHGDTIVGVNQGVAFQSVPRKVLDFLLPGASKGTGSKVTTEASNAIKAAPSAPQKATVASRPAKAQTPKKSQALVPPPKDSISEPLLIIQAMKIISEETGVPVAEMKRDLVLADVGIDSLLSLTVYGRLREELNLEVSSTLFIDYPTVGDIKRWLGGASGPVDASDDSSRISTPRSGVFSDEDNESTSDVSTSVEDTALDCEEDCEGILPFSGICAILAEEIGVKAEEVENASSLAELGLDSLMSLTVLGRLREELDVDLPADALLLDDMALIRKSLGGSLEPEISAPVAPAPAPAVRVEAPATIPPATSVVVQGNLKTASKVLFLFPDGSGSATAYAGLPRVANDVALVALNCPYVKRPQDMKCALQDLTAPYLAEVRRRQAHGPYYLGGWSAGGISAYDAAATLMAQGEEIAGLILLDSPNPIHLEKLPQRLFHFLNRVGVFGSDSSGAPDWLLQHFNAFLDALFKYDIKPFAPGKAPRTHTLWAADGVYKSTGGQTLEEQPDDTREMKWLLNERTNFGPNGWDAVIEPGRLNIEILEGANHFTMMEGSQGQRLSKFLAKALAA